MDLRERFPHLLLAAYLILFVILGIHPYAREVWWAENIPIVGIVLVLVLTYRKFRFSNTAYALMSVLIFLHTIGGHHTFERVPFDFVTHLFGFTRNNFDRLAHFSVGFYAYAIAELLVRTRAAKSRIVLWLFPILSIFTIAAGYEILEWWFAAASDPSAGSAFLGSQGDIWDAQKDMLADGLGSILATITFFLRASYRDGAPLSRRRAAPAASRRKVR